MTDATKQVTRKLHVRITAAGDAVGGRGGASGAGTGGGKAADSERSHQRGGHTRHLQIRQLVGGGLVGCGDRCCISRTSTKATSNTSY